MKKILDFLSENFQVLVLKFSIYLNRCVCVMFSRLRPGLGPIVVFSLISV